MDRSSSKDLKKFVVVKSFGTYIAPVDWYEFKEMSEDQRPFYIKVGIGTETPTSNISVESSENPYGKEKHMDFQRAILQQLSMQLGEMNGKTGVGKNGLIGSGFTSKKGEIVYKFEIKLEDSIIIQYYIVSDFRHCLVHATDFMDIRIPDVDAAAMFIVNSFEWNGTNI